MFRHIYKTIRKELQVMKRIPSFAKREIAVLGLCNIAIGALYVFVAKEQGLLFTAAMLGTIAAVSRTVAAGSIFLKPVSIRLKYIIIVLVNVGLVIVSVGYSMLTPEVWYIAVVSLLAIDNLVKSAFYNDYDCVLKRVLSNTDFRDMMYIEGVMHDVTSVLGSLVGGGLAYWLIDNNSLTTNELQECLYGVSSIYCVCVVLAWSQYEKYFSRLSLEKILNSDVIVTDVTDLYG